MVRRRTVRSALTRDAVDVRRSSSGASTRASDRLLRVNQSEPSPLTDHQTTCCQHWRAATSSVIQFSSRHIHQYSRRADLSPTVLDRYFTGRCRPAVQFKPSGPLFWHCSSRRRVGRAQQRLRSRKWPPPMPASQSVGHSAAARLGSARLGHHPASTTNAPRRPLGAGRPACGAVDQ